MDIEVSKLKFSREKECILGEAKPFVESRGWEIVEIEYPFLSVVLTRSTNKRRLGFRFNCDRWDEQPPSLSLFDPMSPDQELPWEKWPKAGWNAAERHQFYTKPFLCLPGIREYHIHENHRGDLWDNLRPKPSYELRYIVDRVHQKFEATSD